MSLPAVPTVPASSRRHFLQALGGAGSALLFTQCKTLPEQGSTSVTLRQPRLPWPVVFKGEAKFSKLCARARQENWSNLALPTRTVTVGKALCGTPYGNYTLEIDNKVESPSVNFDLLDCWTFYEASLAFARMIKNPPHLWSREAMLHYIELERYRNGVCDGTYVSRMHHLEEVFADNQRRGLGTIATPSLGGVPIRRKVRYMQVPGSDNRYLRNNPAMLSDFARIEASLSQLPITYIPKSRVAAVESQLQDGDVIAVVSDWHSSYTSHVGLAVRDGKNCRFMHATSSRSKGRCCVVDGRISEYLREKSSNYGITVFRPGEAPLLG